MGGFWRGRRLRLDRIGARRRVPFLRCERWRILESWDGHLQSVGATRDLDGGRPRLVAQGTGRDGVDSGVDRQREPPSRGRHDHPVATYLEPLSRGRIADDDHQARDLGVERSGAIARHGLPLVVHQGRGRGRLLEGGPCAGYLTIVLVAVREPELGSDTRIEALAFRKLRTGLRELAMLDETPPLVEESLRLGLESGLSTALESVPSAARAQTG